MTVINRVYALALQFLLPMNDGRIFGVTVPYWEDGYCHVSLNEFNRASLVEARTVKKWLAHRCHVLPTSPSVRLISGSTQPNI